MRYGAEPGSELCRSVSSDCARSPTGCRDEDARCSGRAHTELKRVGRIRRGHRAEIVIDRVRPVTPPLPREARCPHPPRVPCLETRRFSSHRHRARLERGEVVRSHSWDLGPRPSRRPPSGVLADAPRFRSPRWSPLAEGQQSDPQPNSRSAGRGRRLRRQAVSRTVRQ